MNNAFSFSELDDYGHCPWLYRARHVWGLQSKKKSEALQMGSAIHNLLQAHNMGWDVQEAADIAAAEVAQDASLFEDEKKEVLDLIQEAYRIVRGYLAYWAEDLAQEEILHVEEQFTAVLESGKVISCTPDVVVRRPDGRVVVRDYKSTTKTPSYEINPANYQVIMNFAVVRALYPEASHFEFDRLRKKVPTTPRLNKTGARKVNNLKNVDTTYEKLLAFLQDEAPDLLDDPEHRMRLAELRDENRFFYRDVVPVSDTMLEHGLDDVEAQIVRLATSESRESYPRQVHLSGYRACDRCEFESLCRADLLGWDIDRVVREEYEPRDLSYKEYEEED